MTEPVWAVGLMSGTSRDGIDAALIKSDGEGRVEPAAFLSHPYHPEFRTALARATTQAAALSASQESARETGTPPPIAEVERALTERHAEAVRALLEQAGLAAEQVRVVGFHGHTVHHAPRQRRTCQIGDGALLAALTGIDVVADFRSADVAAGGEGAPFAPLYHRARAAREQPPLAVLNLGGVGNVTWLGTHGPNNGGKGDGAVGSAVIAFDTGPANALLDDLVLQRTGSAFDRDGALAAAGTVRMEIVQSLLGHPYFALPPPKSLDRDAFPAAALVAPLSTEDAAATLAAFTVASVARALEHFPEPPRRWLVTGGGRHNAVLMSQLRRTLGVPVEPVEAVGWNGDALEAEAFAYLALRSLAGQPLSLPTTTGVPEAMSGGCLFPAAGA